jgi:hypothetical protein
MELTKCQDFLIEIECKETNQLWASIVNAVDFADATDYAVKLIKEAEMKEALTFEITEL